MLSAIDLSVVGHAETNELRVPVETAPEKDTTPKEGGGNNNVAVQTFTFQELAMATGNFGQERLIGSGDSGEFTREGSAKPGS